MSRTNRALPRHGSEPSASPGALGPGKFPRIKVRGLEHLAVEKDPAVKGQVLGTGRDLAGQGDVLQKGRRPRRIQRARAGVTKKTDVTHDPVQVGLLDADTISRGLTATGSLVGYFEWACTKAINPHSIG